MYTEKDLRQFLSSFNEDMQTKFIETFIDSFNKQMKSCKKAQDQYDSQLLKTSIHDIKSLAYTIGAQELGDLAKRIDENLSYNHHTEAFRDLPKIFPMSQNVLKILEKQLSLVC